MHESQRAVPPAAEIRLISPDKTVFRGGPVEFRLVLAGVRLRLLADWAAAGPLLTRYLEPAWRAEGGDGQPEWLVRSRLIPVRDLDASLEAEGGLAPAPGGFRLSAKGGVRGFVDSAARTLDVDLIREFIFWTDYYRWLPYSTMLRLWLSVELPARDGLVMHGASVRGARGPVLFLGESGAGKSTVCDLSGERLLFNDEISLLRRQQELWSVWPSPFFSRPERLNRARRPEPLAALCLLRQSAEDRLSPLAPTEAVAGVMACLLNFLDDPASAARLLDLSLDLCTRVPVYRLDFRKSPDFWRLLES
jgi:hypothetical protein